MTKANLTLNMAGACNHAQAVVMRAIEDIDEMLRGDNDCALRHPELIISYSIVAAGAYQAAAISDAVDRFLEEQEARDAARSNP
jgi:hypothetical protein